MPDYLIEPLTDAVFDELGPLMQDAFGHGGGREYFNWKYRQNPAGAAIGNIARAGSGEIAAFYGMIPEIFAFQGQARRVYQSCDTMTRSDHRRRGLFQRLAQKTYDEALAADPEFFAYGFGGPTSTPGFVKMGWTISEELPFLFQPFPLTLLSQGRSKAQVTRSISAELIGLMKQAQPTTGPGISRDEQFLRWRFGNPHRQYEFVVAEGAYAVFTRMEGFLFILDFWEQDRQSGSSVIGSLRGVSTDAWMKGLLTLSSARSQFADRLRGHFFIRNRLGRGPASQSTPFITFNSDPFATASRAWTVNALDHDSY